MTNEIQIADSPGSSRQSVHFAFRLGDNVLIKEIGRPGRIVALLVDAEGLTYRVLYWESAKREAAYLPAEEMRLLDDPEL
jgi:hypothetical protein